MIIGLQQQQTEVGRIRLGVKLATSTGGQRPAKLDTLRFTSPRRDLIEKVAELYGGKVEPWSPPKGNGQWQVITTSTEVPVMVPPQDPSESQWFEMWSKGGCLRRCDGQTERISGSSCMCDPDPQERDCKMHTRIRVLLEEVPGIGVWRVDTGSFYAAVELPSVARILAEAKGLIPGKLILDQRTVTRGGKTFNFAVPVLDIAEFTPAELLSGKVPEMAAARRAEAIDNRSRVAIAAGPDYSALLLAVTTIPALTDLWEEAGNAGAITDELRGEFEAKGAAIRKAMAPKAEPVDAEIVDEPGW
ncbi:hypothetical protein [Glycomyces sp. NPDC021274]|uniref:recombination directionality factor n=1 Tax=Glycomyces sp. NPDC021274 TaxID=3155120 RepID=UPI0034035E7F